MAALVLCAAVVVGDSMGGATASGVAVDRPDLVRRLVLMGSAGLVSRIDPALAPILNYDFTREGMVRLVEALTHDGFEIRDEMIDYRMKYAVRDDVRAAYSATMEWVMSSGGLAWDEDYLRDRQSTRLNSSHACASRMPSSDWKKQVCDRY